ncbi:MerR family DNA-binding transcriptional regulator [Glycomyces niveus]|uniref:MerR family DNA-binding transcriptional regulator n=1 Tax=Glycomyces niveus TaxID=2820287 RepID=UPI0038CBF9FF
MPALRHYDEVGLLLPAPVDPGTGYRRYRLDQAPQATLIRHLRSVDVSRSHSSRSARTASPSAPGLVSCPARPRCDPREMV